MRRAASIPSRPLRPQGGIVQTIALILALASAPDCLITWVDGHQLTVESYTVAAGRVRMLDLAGDVLVAREDQIDLEATARTCPPPEPAESASKARGVKKSLSLVEASELALAGPHGGGAMTTAGTEGMPVLAPEAQAASAGPAPTTEGGWASTLSAMRSRARTLRADLAADKSREAALVKEHNFASPGTVTEAKDVTKVSTGADRDIIRQQVARLRDKIADGERALAVLVEEYAAKQEEARRAGMPASVWRDSI